MLFLSQLSEATQQNLCIRPRGCTTQRPEELTAPEIEPIPFPGSAAILCPGGSFITWQELVLVSLPPSKSLAAFLFSGKESTTCLLAPCEILKRGIAKSRQHHLEHLWSGGLAESVCFSSLFGSINDVSDLFKPIVSFNSVFGLLKAFA